MKGKWIGWMVMLVMAITVAIVGNRAIAWTNPEASGVLAQVSSTAPVSQPKGFTIAIDSPVPLSGEYKDPADRFAIGILKDYKMSPLVGSALFEAIDGNLAYTVIAQPQPLGRPLGIPPVSSIDDLAKVAIATLQRGEGFQAGLPRLEAEGNVAIDWSGTLTSGSTIQPVSGRILVRPSAKYILVVLLAATEAGTDRLPAAVSALASSLRPL